MPTRSTDPAPSSPSALTLLELTNRHSGASSFPSMPFPLLLSLPTNLPSRSLPRCRSRAHRWYRDRMIYSIIYPLDVSFLSGLRTQILRQRLCTFATCLGDYKKKKKKDSGVARVVPFPPPPWKYLLVLCTNAEKRCTRGGLTAIRFVYPWRERERNLTRRDNRRYLLLIARGSKQTNVVRLHLILAHNQSRTLFDESADLIIYL